MPEVPSVAPPPLPKSQPSFGRRYSTILKLLGVGALVLVLLIPLAMITGVLSERLRRRNEAVADITSSWGKEQNLIGPVLGIPYQYKFKTVKEVPLADGRVERREVEETATGNAYFLPETLNISGNAQTQKLHRGIYDAVVYRAQTVLSGKFVPPDFGPLKIDLKDVQWKDAFVTIAINDLRGTREAIVLDWGGTKRPMLPGSQVPGYTTGATASLGSDQPISNEIQFSIPLDFNGSEGIFFAPFGVQNEATLKSNSADVGFRGAFLPAERSLRADGIRCEMEGLVLRTGLSAIVDEPHRQRAIHDASRFKFTFRRAIFVHPRRVSLRRTLDQIRSALSRACFHGVLSLRSDSAPKDSSLSISHGRCRALFVLPAAGIDFGIY
jgi:inner membrane protein